MLEITKILEIKALGLKVGPGSTQDQLKRALELRPELEKMGIITRTNKTKSSDDKKDK